MNGRNANYRKTRYNCPVCSHYDFRVSDSYEICPFCGWENSSAAETASDIPQIPNHISLSDYRLFYSQICKDNPLYKWEDSPEKWEEFISGYMEQMKMNKEYTHSGKLVCSLADLPRQTLNIIASRPANGEEGFLLGVIVNGEQQNRHIDFFDLYNDSFSEFYERCIASDNVTAHSAVIDADTLFSEIRKIVSPDIIILRGIQSIQETPFSPAEMTAIVRQLRMIATDSNATVIIYSGLTRECDVHTPTVDDLKKIGISEADTDFIMVLKNHTPIILKNSTIKLDNTKNGVLAR